MFKISGAFTLIWLSVILCASATEIGPAGWIAKTGSANPSVVTFKNQTAVKMPCNFAESDIQRGCWDLPVNLNLTGCETIEFNIFCTDRTAVSRFNLYMQSGDGWYIAPFDIENTGAWNTIRIHKKNTEWEGNPAGWSNISTLRISAWRGGNKNTDLYISGMRYIENKASIAIVRSESSAKGQTSAAKTAVRFTSSVANQLDELGIQYNILSDNDITASSISSRKLVVLPYNPTLPGRALKELDHYLEKKGKMLCFYTMPEKLESRTGIKTGEHLNQQYSGQFASIRPSSANPLNLPRNTQQNSWNIRRTSQVQGKSTIAAIWFDAKGQSTGEPAIIFSDNCIFMTHVFIDDDPDNKRDLLLGMIGKFLPELFRISAETGIKEIGIFGPYSDTESTIKILSAHARRNRRANALLLEAIRLQEDAKKFLQKNNYTSARSHANRARSKLIETYCTIQPSQSGEFRGFWCHNPMGVSGLSWDQAIKNLADNGFTAIFPNFAWGGTAFYNSSVLPVSSEIKSAGDQLILCLAACKKYNIECHVWKVSWNMGPYAEKTFIEKMRKENRLQQTRNGTVNERWLCPTHPANQKLEIDAMLELVRKYEIDGIHFDYIRYQSNDHCFCSGCRNRFESIIGRKTQNWPGDTENNAQTRNAWQKFRQDNINTVVRSVSEQARKIKPRIKISAAVFPDWNSSRNAVAQDWKLWCEKGYLDFICPMNYTTSGTHFEQMVKQQAVWSGKTPFYPGIGLSTWSRSGDICRLIEQVRITRETKTGGFMIFEYGPSEARDVVPLCGSGLTAK